MQQGQLFSQVLCLLELLHQAFQQPESESSDALRQKIIRQVLQIQTDLGQMHEFIHQSIGSSQSIEEEIAKIKEKINRLERQQMYYYGELQNLLREMLPDGSRMFVNK
jgi:septal ring factor EnvC (AmiA/AmiB activator)